MKKLGIALITASLLCVWVARVASANAGLTVYIRNISTQVPQAELVNDLPAFQAAVSQDFAPFWGQDATLSLDSAPGAWVLTIGDDSPIPFALGYHEVNGDTPDGFAFARSSINDGGDWQVTFTHELFEMLADPYINRVARGPRRFWLVEVADPVEADGLAYLRNGADGTAIPISDFVTPAWYRSPSHGPWDFEHLTSHPFQLLRGGYASYWANGSWTQIVNWYSGIRSPKAPETIGTRTRLLDETGEQRRCKELSCVQVQIKGGSSPTNATSPLRGSRALG